MIFRLLLLISLSVTVASAQVHKPAAKTKSKATADKTVSLKTMPVRQVFMPEDKTFSIALPAGPKIEISPEDKEKGITVTQYKWKVNEGAFTVMRTVSSKETFSTPAEIEAILARGTRGLKNDPQFTVESDRKINHGRYGGVEMTVIHTSGFRMTLRNFAYGSVIYSLISTPLDLIPASEKFLLKAMDSFKIADAEPAKVAYKDLPQTPPDATQNTTDAQEAYLKGKVRTVLLTHKDSADETMWSEKSFYSERGDLVRVLFYDAKGNLSSINYFGYIGGARVSLKVNPNDRTQKLPPAGFDTKYTYIYDPQGRLARKTLTHQNGVETTDHKYDGGRLIRFYNDTEKNFRSRREITFDEKGNIATRSFARIIDGESAAQEIETFTYGPLDKNGNWTAASVTMKRSPQDSEPYLRYSETREITYY